MSACICPEDGRTIPSSRRVIVMEPGAEKREGNVTVKDLSKVHIFDKNCPVHGYTVVEEEGTISEH